MAGGTALIAYRGYPLMAKIIVSPDRIVIVDGRRPVCRERRQIGPSANRQIVAAESGDRGGIGCISVRVMDIGREAVDVEKAASGKGLGIVDKGRIKPGVQRVGLRDPVVRDSDTASQDQP